MVMSLDLYEVLTTDRLLLFRFCSAGLYYNIPFSSNTAHRSRCRSQARWLAPQHHFRITSSAHVVRATCV